jgi:hypothetical protein
MSFFGSLFGGSNPTLNSNIQQYGQIGSFATGMGEKDTSQASNFWSNILSGDSSKIAQSLAPQISAAKTSANQNNKTTAEFGTRSGGNAASTAATNDKVHSDITNLIGSLTGNSASNLASLGSSSLNTGLSAIGAQTQASQQQMQNWSNSILGKTISQGIGAAVTGATGGLGTEVSTLGSGNFGW